MKRVHWFVIIIFALNFFILKTITVAQSDSQQNAPKLLYVKTDKENLRLSPNGTIIGQVDKSTELNLLDQKGKWVKVAIVAWMWEPSTTEDKGATLGPQYKASIIMLETLEDAQSVLTRLKAGEDFGVLAKGKSIHPTAAKDGDLGFFRKGDFSPEFERAIFAVQKGQTTGIVEVKLQDKIYFCIFKRTQ
ncbi:peptidylprolyl isomerase [candidate division KSB1 bacterium]|nr:peptidylprolyl isomerase [candidate division KSB1 bacterium]